MAFQLNKVVPWGRRFSEYRKMFCLSDEELRSNKIISFGDGPASFNAEGTEQGYRIVSVDPIYQFSVSELQNRFSETKEIILEQARKNRKNYIWDTIKSIDELKKLRMSAMNLFLSDYELGLTEKRYVYGELPDKTEFPDNSFDIGLSSHFLLLYSALELDFHIHSIHEMLRICKEVRIFPICDLNSKKTKLLERVIDHFSKSFRLEIYKTSYEFQKNANEMLVIKNI